MNVTECLVRDMASVSSHTGSATVTNPTNNGSDVVLGDRRPFKTQRSDHFKTWSYIMIVPHVTPLNVPNMLNRCKIRISSWPRWCNDVLILPRLCPSITTTMKNKNNCCKSFFKISAVALQQIAQPNYLLML